MTARSSAPRHLPLSYVLLATVLFNTAIAAMLTALHGGFVEHFVISQCVGLSTWALIDLPRRRLWPHGAPPRAPMFALIVGAALAGWFGGSVIAGLLLGKPDLVTGGGFGVGAVPGFLALTTGAGVVGTLFFWSREHLASTERGAAEARLKLLQAQIEPHFLFNTLANLQALIAADPPRAQAMLGALDTYLRATLASARNEESTLADEFALLRAYLDIIAMRMGARLAFELDLPDALAAATLPPMLLQPLVENAIQHGLEPKVEGGRVRVAARAEGEQLVLDVEDTGLGLGGAATAGTGVGLAHVRQRLAARYGAAASASIADHPAGGVGVTLRIPLTT